MADVQTSAPETEKAEEKKGKKEKKEKKGLFEGQDLMTTAVTILIFCVAGWFLLDAVGGLLGLVAGGVAALRP